MDEMSLPHRPTWKKSLGLMWIKARQTVYCPITECFYSNIEARDLKAFVMRCPLDPDWSQEAYKRAMGFEDWSFGHMDHCSYLNHTIHLDFTELAHIDEPWGFLDHDDYLNTLNFLCVASELRKVIRPGAPMAPPLISDRLDVIGNNDIMRVTSRREMADLVMNLHPREGSGEFIMQAASDLAIEKNLEEGCSNWM